MYPQFFRVALFDTPESPAYWKGYAALVSGDSLYGKIVLLETLHSDGTEPELGQTITVADWEWCGGRQLTEAETKKCTQLYESFKKRREKMKYAVKIFNYLKGTYEAALFEKKQDAVKCFDLMKEVEEAEDGLADAVNQAALEKSIAYEDDLPARKFSNAVKVEDFVYARNIEGRVRQESSAVTFVNSGDYITVPA